MVTILILIMILEMTNPMNSFIVEVNKNFVKLTKNCHFHEKFFNFLAAAMMEQRVLGQDVQGEAGGQDAPVIPMFQVFEGKLQNFTPRENLKIPPRLFFSLFWTPHNVENLPLVLTIIYNQFEWNLSAKDWLN